MPMLKTEVNAAVHTYITWRKEATLYFALHMQHSIPNLAHNVYCVYQALNKLSSHLKEQENFSETTQRLNPLQPR